MALPFVGVFSPAVSRPPRMTMVRAGSDGNAKFSQKQSIVSKPGTSSIGVNLKTKPAPRAPAPVQVAVAPATAAAAAAAVAPAPAAPASVSPTPSPVSPGDLPINRSDFPEGFLFGAASSSYQVEGAWQEGGKGLSAWDVFTHERPEMIKDRSNGDVAVDFYHRYEEDLGYLKGAGFDGYRFSISWPRILPTGSLSGGINKEGIAHYNKVIDSLLAKGLIPLVTLFHWETPEELEKKYESLLSQQFVDDYKDFVNICFKEFGDRVKHWITFNEPSLVCELGYSLGILPPARCSPWMDGNCAVGDSAIEPYLAGHHILLAHAAAVLLYRSEYQIHQQGKIGMTLTTSWFLPYDKTSKADQDAVARGLDFNLGWFLDPLTQGDYPYSMRATAGNRLPRFTRQQAGIVAGSFDFIGFNYYTSYYLQSQPFIPSPQGNSWESDTHFLSTGVNKEGVQLGNPIGNHPEGLRSILLYIKDKYNNPPIYITENGLKMPNGPYESLDEALNDAPRIDYHNQHLTMLNAAINEGAKVEAYFMWSFSDSFEFNSGYTNRFGLVFIDYDNDLKRYLKFSYQWFKDFLKPREQAVSNSSVSIATNNHAA